MSRKELSPAIVKAMPLFRPQLTWLVEVVGAAPFQLVKLLPIHDSTSLPVNEGTKFENITVVQVVWSFVILANGMKHGRRGVGNLEYGSNRQLTDCGLVDGHALAFAMSILAPGCVCRLLS